MNDYLIALFGLFPFFIFAQKSGFNEVVFSALTDVRLTQNQQTTEVARNLNFKVPLIRRAEARLGFNGSTLGDSLYGSVRNEDFYGFVIGPNSLRERKRQEDLKNAYIRQYQSERPVLLAAVLLERYQAITGWYFTKKIGVEQQNLADLTVKKMEILREKLEQGLEVKVSDVLEAESDQNNLLLQIQETNNLARFHQAKLLQWLPDYALPPLDSSNMIAIRTIERRVSTLKNTRNTAPILAFRQSQVQLASADRALENAQNRQIFNFLQIGYEDPVLPLVVPNRRRTFNNFSFRIALEVPIPGNNNPQRATAALEVLEARNNAQNAVQLNEKNVALQFVRVENLLASHKDCIEKTENSLIRRMLNDEKLRFQMSAAELLEAQIIEQKLLLRRITIEQEIMTEYIRLLDLKGVTAQEPLSNYLSEK